MRRVPAVITVAIAVTLSGCATHQVVPQRIISTSWSTVSSLAPGTNVGVALDDDEVRYGRVSEVTPDTLTIWGRHGAAHIPRDRIARLAILTSTGTSRAPNVIKWSLIGAAITGALAYFAASIEENDQPDGGQWTIFFAGTTIGAAVGSQMTPVERFREQVIYIRP
jgi:hypothetical protein